MANFLYNTVFISHSKDDPNLAFFQNLFSQLKAKSVWMEFENISSPPFVSIRDMVNQSDAIFVLLSNYLIERPYTNNWVSFEIGLAANSNLYKDKDGKLKALGLDVWVFEPMDKNISYSVPYCTHYMKYQTIPEEVRSLRDRLEARSSDYEVGVRIICPNKDCGLSFVYLSAHTKKLTCPACRKEMKLTDGCDLYAEAERIARKAMEGTLKMYKNILSEQEIEQLQKEAMR